jgi:hypothetical protein
VKRGTITAVAALLVGGAAAYFWYGPLRHRSAPAAAASAEEAAEEAVAASPRPTKPRRSKAQRSPVAAPNDSAEADERDPLDDAVRDALKDDGLQAARQQIREDAARTKAWERNLDEKLKLTSRQRTALDDIADWTDDERDDLVDKVELEKIDSEAVRAAIEAQRVEYEKRIKELLTPEQYAIFDGIQGPERMPPTFSTVEWVEGAGHDGGDPQTPGPAGAR